MILCRLLLKRVGEEGQHFLVFVQQQHSSKIAQSFVREQWTGSQLQTFNLTKMGRVSEHVNVKQLGDVGMAELCILLLERSSNECRLFLDDSPFIRVGLAGTDGLDEV